MYFVIQRMISGTDLAICSPLPYWHEPLSFLSGAIVLSLSRDKGITVDIDKSFLVGKAGEIQFRLFLCSFSVSLLEGDLSHVEALRDLRLELAAKKEVIL